MIFNFCDFCRKILRPETECRFWQKFKSHEVLVFLDSSLIAKITPLEIRFHRFYEMTIRTEKLTRNLKGKV